MNYISKLYEGTTNVIYYVKYPFNYFNKHNENTKQIKELDGIDIKKLSPYVQIIYDNILLHNNLIFDNKNINPLVYQLAKLYSDIKIYSYSYSIHKICEIIYENYVGNKFIAIYDYDYNNGYNLATYNGKGDYLHKTKFNNSITQNFGHVDILAVEYMWNKFDICYEAEYQVYNKIFVPCIDNPFSDLKKNSINKYKIVIIYFSNKITN